MGMSIRNSCVALSGTRIVGLNKSGSESLLPARIGTSLNDDDVFGHAPLLAPSVNLIRMLKKSTSGVLASLRGSTYRSVRLASSLSAALLDGLFEHPSEEWMVRGASRRNVIGSSSRIAEESPGPSLFDEVMHLAHPTINGDGLPRLFLRPVEPSGAGHMRFPGAIGLDQFQLGKDMG